MESPSLTYRWVERLLTFFMTRGSGSGTTSMSAESFAHSCSLLSEDLGRLILAAEVSVSSLYKLEEQLRTIRAILALEGIVLNSEMSQLQTKVWSILGGNRARVAMISEKLMILEELSHYRDKALVRVVAALQVSKNPLISRT